MNSATSEAADPAVRSVPWGTVGAVVIGVLILLPVIYRLTWRAAKDANATDVNIEYMAWGTPSQLASDREIIRRFNQRCIDRGLHEKVELLMPPAGGYTQKLLMMLAGGSAPDVCRVDHYDFDSMAIKGYFHDLTDLAANDPEFHADDFHAVTMRENHFRGRLYGLNVVFGGLICYYNADLFRHAGLADPYTLWKAGKWDWAAFDDAARRLTVRDAKGKTVSFGIQIPGSAIGPSAVHLALFLWRFGGDFLSADRSHCVLNSPQSVRGIQRLRDMIFKEKIAPTPSDQAASLFSFESGNIAMTFDTAGNAPQLRDSITTFDWDIAPTPSDPGNEYTQVKGNQLCVTAQSKHPREAWEWIKFLTSAETETYLYGDAFRRNVPTRVAVLKSPAFLKAEHPPFHTDVYADVVDHGRELPIDETYPTWTTTLQRYIQRLFVDDSADTAAVMKDATAAVNEDLVERRARFERYAEGGGAHAQ